mgnify:CR=1 FL=1|tara:strand:- start:2053 stop:2946 length:894 start_codon:yes stop_codon:yes gene_type:complete
MDIRRKPPNPRIRVETLEYSIPHEDSAPKNILEEIVWYKDKEITNFKNAFPLEEFLKNIDKLSPTKGFLTALSKSVNKPAIIAEIKKASPSKGVIRDDFNPEEIALIYEKSGASCISVLTDQKFFKGSFDILSKVRAVTNLPLLCKDFIISAYQIYKARFSGADAILLIAAILEDSDLVYLKKIADQLNMDVLVEIHNNVELERILNLNCFNLIGINNRDLKTFKTNINNTVDIMKSLSINKNGGINNEIFISESGIKSYKDLKLVESIGVSGVLIGEIFMKEENIAQSFRRLLKSV